MVDIKKDNIADVIFNEREHSYTYRGVKMLGVNGAIQTLLGKSFPEGVATQVSRILQKRPDFRD